MQGERPRSASAVRLLRGALRRRPAPSTRTCPSTSTWPGKGGTRRRSRPSSAQPAAVHDRVSLRPPVHGQLHAHGLGRVRADPRDEEDRGGERLRGVPLQRAAPAAGGTRACRRAGSRRRSSAQAPRGWPRPRSLPRRVRGPRLRTGEGAGGIVRYLLPGFRIPLQRGREGRPLLREIGAQFHFGEGTPHGRGPEGTGVPRRPRRRRRRGRQGHRHSRCARCAVVPAGVPADPSRLGPAARWPSWAPGTPPWTRRAPR